MYSLGRSLSTILNDTNDTSCRDLFQKAYSEANKEGMLVNTGETFQEGGEITSLWESTDYMHRVLAGTVAIAAIKRGSKVDFGFIGNCRMVVVSRDGQIVWRSLTENTNKVAQAQQAFSHLRKALPAKDHPDYQIAYEKYIREVHTQFRNNPSASSAESPHASYGVLTGQQEAVNEQYLFTGTIELEEGHSLLLYTDGMDPYIEDPEFLKMLYNSPPQEQIKAYIDDHREQDTLNDDKTLILVKN